MFADAEHGFDQRREKGFSGERCAQSLPLFDALTCSAHAALQGAVAGGVRGQFECIEQVDSGGV